MWITAVVIAVLLACYFLWHSNNSIEITTHQYKSEKVPQCFDGFKIMQVSDLHNKSFGKNHQKLIEKIKFQAPNAIFITGDLVDRRRSDIGVAMDFIAGAVKLAPVYYVCGNHESMFGIYEEIKPLLIKAGVIVLEKQTVEISKNSQTINLTGFPDPWHDGDFYENAKDYKSAELQEYFKLADFSRLNILLCHRPELAPYYAKTGVDIAFSGHAHGGQIRIPIINKSILSPHQGFFPKYAMGRYDIDRTTLFVSRGLGNSRFPFRVFNKPELVVVNLETKK